MSRAAREIVGVVRPTARLMDLAERAGVAAGRITGVPSAQVAAERRAAIRAQARWSARLDASPLDDATAERVDREGLDAALDAAGLAAAATPADESSTARAGWAEALRMGEVPTQALAAREYANLRATAAVEDEVVPIFFDRPLEAITRLHERICDGLVAPEVVTRLRRTDRAVHDGAQGQMLWAAPAPERVPQLIDALLEWLGGPSAAQPTLVVAGVVHERLLEWQPFEAAAGRLARAAARVVRRARGLDPAGLAVPEQIWAADPLRYHREVAASIRRRGDLSTWVERTTHAEVVALEQVAARLAPRPAPSLAPRVREYLAGLGPGRTVAVREYAAETGVSRERALADLTDARAAGVLQDDPSVAGLRFLVVADAAS